MNNTAYSGDTITLESGTNNLIVSTLETFKMTPLWLEIYFTDPLCSFISTQKIDLDIEICGEESVVIDAKDEEYTLAVKKTPNFVLTNLTDGFSVA